MPVRTVLATANELISMCEENNTLIPDNIMNQFLTRINEEISYIVGMIKDAETRKDDKEYEGKDITLRMEQLNISKTMLNVERQVYLAYINKNNVEIFDKLNDKYLDLNSKCLEIVEKMVGLGDIQEADYIRYAKGTVSAHKLVSRLCKNGKNYTKKILKKSK